MYLDASAIVKLVIVEAESAALQSRIDDWPQAVSSSIAEVEVFRAIRRVQTDPRSHGRAREILDKVLLLEVDGALRRTAAVLGPATLRALDAIHLASALTLGNLVGFVTYDHRLLAAASAAGLPALAPGQARTAP